MRQCWCSAMVTQAASIRPRPSPSAPHTPTKSRGATAQAGRKAPPLVAFNTTPTTSGFGFADRAVTGAPRRPRPDAVVHVPAAGGPRPRSRLRLLDRPPPRAVHGHERNQKAPSSLFAERWADELPDFSAEPVLALLELAGGDQGLAVGLADDHGRRRGFSRPTLKPLCGPQRRRRRARWRKHARGGGQRSSPTGLARAMQPQAYSAGGPSPLSYPRDSQRAPSRGRASTASKLLQPSACFPHDHSIRQSQPAIQRVKQGPFTSSGRGRLLPGAPRADVLGRRPFTFTPIGPRLQAEGLSTSPAPKARPRPRPPPQGVHGRVRKPSTVTYSLALLNIARARS
jgi:hypothetical protein